MELSRIAAIKRYFGTDRDVTLKELRELSKDERTELAEGAAKELGVTLKEVAPVIPIKTPEEVSK